MPGTMSKATEQTRMEKLLLEAARTFNSTLEYEELNELVLKLVVAAVESEAAMIYRSDPERTDLRTRFMNCSDCQMVTIEREQREGVVGWVHENCEALILNNVANDPRIDPELERITGLKARSIIALPLIGRGKLIGVVEAINKIDGEFDESDMDILRGLNNQIAVAIDNAHLYRVAKQEALEKDLLYETSKAMSSKLTLEDLMATILESLKRVVYFETGGVFLYSGDANLDAIYSVGYGPDSEERLHLKSDEGIVGASTTSGEAIIVPDVSADPRYIMANPNIKSEIVIPIRVDDRVIGVINLESPELDAFSERHVSLVSAFASHAGISIERAMMHKRNMEAQTLAAQLGVARETQRTFLPKKDPTIPGYDISGHNTPSGQVGGDYYDFIRIVDSHLGIPIADVSGKGMPAALVMASFRASLIAEIRNNYSIRTIVEKVNSLLCESLESGVYVTGVYSVLDSINHILTFSNFGHNPPLLLRRDGQVELLTEGGMILGVSPQARFEERALMLQPGELVVMYTDGVTEVFDREGREFGREGLTRVVEDSRDKSCAEIADAVRNAVADHAATGSVFDDLTLVVLKRNHS